MSSAGDTRQEAIDSLPGGVGYLDAGKLRAAQRHDHPAKLAHVALVAGVVTPAAVGAILAPQQVVHRALDGIGKSLVARQCVGFGQGERGHRMAVGAGVERRAAGQVAFGVLRANQEHQPASNLLLVRTFEMRMSRAEEREQRESGDRGVGLATGPTPVVTQHHEFAPCLPAIGIPPPVGRLRVGEPFERAGDGLFGFATPPLLDHRLQPVGADALGQRRGQGGLGGSDIGRRRHRRRRRVLGRLRDSWFGFACSATSVGVVGVLSAIALGCGSAAVFWATASDDAATGAFHRRWLRCQVGATSGSAAGGVGAGSTASLGGGSTCSGATSSGGSSAGGSAVAARWSGAVIEGCGAIATMVTRTGSSSPAPGGKLTKRMVAAMAINTACAASDSNTQRVNGRRLAQRLRAMTTDAVNTTATAIQTATDQIETAMSGMGGMRFGQGHRV